MGDLRRTNETATEDDLRDLFSLEADEEMQSIYRVCAGSWLYDGGGRWRFHADPECGPMTDAYFTQQTPVCADLLPCPFCGGKPHLTNGGPGNHYVKCDGCRASSDDGSVEYAVEYWNRRAALPKGEPAGWKLVPIEPTEAMIAEAGERIVREYAESDWEEAKDMAEGLNPAQVWNAMIAAAPPAGDEQKPTGLEQLRDLSDRSTAGPWKITSAPGGWDAVKSVKWGSLICHLDEQHTVNAEFIAAAVNFVRNALGEGEK